MLNLTTNTCVDLARSSARHGAGLYESIRIRHGRALRLEEHLARLAHGAAFLGLEAPPDLDEVETFLDRRTDCACLASGLLRLLAVDEALMVSACPWEPSHPTRIDIALAGRICRRAAHPLNRFKTLACLENLLLRREADDRALFEVIALNEAGRLTDGSRMSLFLVQGEVVLTPAVQDGAFPGIARGSLLQAGLVREASLDEEALRRADAVFLTSALHGVVPVNGVEGGVPKAPHHPLVKACAACLNMD